MTPTQRDSITAKSPVLGGDPVASHSPFDPHHRPVVPGEVYRGHLPPHLDPLTFHRVLDPGRDSFIVIPLGLFSCFDVSADSDESFPSVNPCLSFPVQQRSCFPGNHHQPVTTTPTSCTPWRTRGRPSSMTTSLPNRCRSSLGPMWPGACHHGNSRSLSRSLRELEVCPSSSRPSNAFAACRGRGCSVLVK